MMREFWQNLLATVTVIVLVVSAVLGLIAFIAIAQPNTPMEYKCYRKVGDTEPTLVVEATQYKAYTGNVLFYYGKKWYVADTVAGVIPANDCAVVISRVLEQPQTGR